MIFLCPWFLLQKEGLRHALFHYNLTNGWSIVVSLMFIFVFGLVPESDALQSSERWAQFLWSWLFGSVATGAVTTSAVARDSPETMGEAADTPHCPVLQRDWLGEGQLCSLTWHKWGRGGAGPLLALSLQRGHRVAARSLAFKHADSLLVDSLSWERCRKSGFH